MSDVTQDIDRTDQGIHRRFLQPELPKMFNVQCQPRITDRPAIKHCKGEAMVLDAESSLESCFDGHCP